MDEKLLTEFIDTVCTPLLLLNVLVDTITWPPELVIETEEAVPIAELPAVREVVPMLNEASIPELS